MDRAVNNRRFAADIFHDIDLTTGGPSRCADVVAQHPKSRPDSLTIRNLDTCFKPSVGLREFIPGEQSRRSIVAPYIVRPGKSFFQCLDHQRAVLKNGVGGATRVGLEFVVPPTVAADVKGPLGRINR